MSGQQNHRVVEVSHLTEEDAELLARKLEERLVQRFHMNLGKGVWALAWKVILGVVLAVAAYGSIKAGARPF